MYRVGIEAILGFRREADALSLDPCIPKGWKGFTLEYRHGGTPYAIEVRNPAGTGRGVREVRMDGAVLPEGRIPLVDDGRRREIVVELG
jgi:cellobiose phosphorylase